MGNDATGDASLAAAVLWLVAVIVAAFMDHQRAALDVSEFESRRGHCLLDAARVALEEGQIAGESVFWQAVNFVVSVVVLAALFAMLFRWFPDADASWEAATKGGLATSLLFNIGKLGISWYVGSQGLESTYGAAASIVVLLIWVYYSAQIVLFGAEVTHVLGNSVSEGRKLQRNRA